MSSSIQETALSIQEPLSPGASKDNLDEKLESTTAISSDTEPDNVAEQVYPSGIKLALTTLALLLAAILAGLDRSIIATAIPQITTEFNSLDDIGWYGSSYLLTNCSFQLLWGKIYGVFPIKWTIIVSIVIFEIGSLVSGVAPTSTALIIGRAVAGLGSSGIVSGSLVIISFTVPLNKRPLYTSLIISMFTLGGVVAPILGGLFTDNLTWRWCFYINFPVGGISLAIIIFFLSLPQDSERVKTFHLREIQKFDLLGTSIFVPANVCLLLALQWGGNSFSWNSWRIILLFCLSGLLFITWGMIQWVKKELATLPPHIISQRSMAFGVWYGFTMGSSMFIVIYFLPLWFQAVKGTSATHSGVDFLPMTLAMGIFAIISGAITTRVGYYVPAMFVGSILQSIGAGLFSTLKVSTGHASWIGFQVITGAGIGSGMQQPIIAAQTVLAPADISTGLAAIIFAQTMGGTIFVSVAQTAFANKLLSSLHTHVPGLDPEIVINNGASGLRNVVGKVGEQFVPGVLLAYNEAIASVFTVCVVMACLTVVGALGMEWKSVKGKKGGKKAPA